ncbi:hypothetical protein [Microbacterium marinilacus]|uniref:Tripartite tricarboxylate transporter TctB family protein n=1 Tax=Microbacterium marinilacus TaxID=415209 RepID=A0ABP7BQ97_9MICO|nr:hypothetical protein [Microbacterium marinilacus]MBY0689796.1 hypothetical protein [Microbacterium marinilacus]
MPAALFRLLREPDGWAYALLAVAALAAAVDGIVLVAQAGGSGERAAAGWFVGAVGVVLLALVVAGVGQDLRGRQVSVVTAIATVIIAEEEAAGRDVEDRFSADAPLLPRRRIVRTLAVSAVLMIAWMVLLPWLGFGLVTGLFCLAFMRLVSASRWWVAIVTAVCVGAGLAVLFPLSGVLLPTGALWYLI